MIATIGWVIYSNIGQILPPYRNSDFGNLSRLWLVENWNIML
jgi:hypothetical protein